MKQSENKVAKETCKALLDEALAGCVVSGNGIVSFFYGSDSLVTTDAEDAAAIIQIIGKLLREHRHAAKPTS